MVCGTVPVPAASVLVMCLVGDCAQKSGGIKSGQQCYAIALGSQEL